MDSIPRTVLQELPIELRLIVFEKIIFSNLRISGIAELIGSSNELDLVIASGLTGCEFEINFDCSLYRYPEVSLLPNKDSISSLQYNLLRQDHVFPLDSQSMAKIAKFMLRRGIKADFITWNIRYAPAISLSRLSLFSLIDFIGLCFNDVRLKITNIQFGDIQLLKSNFKLVTYLEISLGDLINTLVDMPNIRQLDIRFPYADVPDWDPILISNWIKEHVTKFNLRDLIIHYNGKFEISKLVLQFTSSLIKFRGLSLEIKFDFSLQDYSHKFTDIPIEFYPHITHLHFQIDAPKGVDSLTKLQELPKLDSLKLSWKWSLANNNPNNNLQMIPIVNERLNDLSIYLLNHKYMDVSFPFFSNIRILKLYKCYIKSSFINSIPDSVTKLVFSLSEFELSTIKVPSQLQYLKLFLFDRDTFPRIQNLTDLESLQILDLQVIFSHAPMNPKLSESLELVIEDLPTSLLLLKFDSQITKIAPKFKLNHLVNLKELYLNADYNIFDVFRLDWLPLQSLENIQIELFLRGHGRLNMLFTQNMKSLDFNLLPRSSKDRLQSQAADLFLLHRDSDANLTFINTSIVNLNLESLTIRCHGSDKIDLSFLKTYHLKYLNLQILDWMNDASFDYAPIPHPIEIILPDSSSEESENVTISLLYDTNFQSHVTFYSTCFLKVRKSDFCRLNYWPIGAFHFIFVD